MLPKSGLVNAKMGGSRHLLGMKQGSYQMPPHLLRVVGTGVIMDEVVDRNSQEPDLVSS